jgi:hypothetical protein
LFSTMFFHLCSLSDEPQLRRADPSSAAADSG